MELPERDQRYLEKKYAHLLGNGTEKYDREAQDKEAEKELEERPIHWQGWLVLLLFAPLWFLVHFFVHLGKLDRKANAEVTESITVSNLLKFVRIALGISGCALFLWVLSTLFIELIFVPHPYLNRALSTITMLITFLCGIGCIFIFLYSFFGLFGGKKERYFRLAAQVVLVTIWFWYWIDPNYYYLRLADAEQSFQFRTGIYVAFICLFPRTYNGRRFLASIILLYILFVLGLIFGSIRFPI